MSESSKKSWLKAAALCEAEDKAHDRHEWDRAKHCLYHSLIRPQSLC